MGKTGQAMYQLGLVVDLEFAVYRSDVITDSCRRYTEFARDLLVGLTRRIVLGYCKFPHRKQTAKLLANPRQLPGDVLLVVHRVVHLHYIRC